MKIHVLALFLFATATLSFSQSIEKFSGVVTYRYTESPKGAFPLILEKITITSNVFYQQVLETRNNLFLNDVLCDLSKSKRYEVNHYTKTMMELGTEPSAKIEVINETQLSDTIIHGENCRVVQLIRHGTTYDSKEITYTYYLSKTKEIENIKTLATLQGNNNSKILDGRFRTLPLLVIMRYEGGKTIKMEAIKVEPVHTDLETELANYKK